MRSAVFACCTSYLNVLISFLVAMQSLSAQVYESPQAAAADKDFAVQGEYASDKLGVQVIALGDGEFDIVVYQGGLPGAGWDRTPPQRTDGDGETVAELVRGRGVKRVERKSPTLGATAPINAIVLFDGSQAAVDKHWRAGAKRTDDGLLVRGAMSVETFQDYSVHVEFRTPYQPKARGQGRGNSGVYHQGRYETQILDSFGLEGKNNEAGGIYTVRDPDLNMCFPPLTWQTYDVDFTAARFEGAKKVRDALLTVRLNGVVVQRDVKVPHTTTAAPEKESSAAGPIYIQDHGNPVFYRNIWVVPRDAAKDARRPRIPAFERFYAEQSSASSQSPAQATASEQSQVGGQILISQLGCAACHETENENLLNRSAPLLGQVGGRVRPDHLLKFIAAPHETKLGTVMPDLFHGISAEERLRQSQAIASYLLASGQLIDRSGDAAAAERGEKAFHSIGCVACHAPRRGDANLDATSVPLGDLTAKYTLDSLSRFLSNPHAVRPSGLMPKLVNDAGEARDVACYLLGETIIVPGSEQFQARVFFGSWDKLPDFTEMKPAKSGLTSGLDLKLAGRDSDFAMTFEAYLPVAVSGEYRFFLSSDDGSRLLIDGKQVVEFDGIHPASVRQGKVKLDAGVHSIRVEYFEKGGEEVLTLDVAGPDFGRTPIATLITSEPNNVVNKELIPAVFKPKAGLVANGKELFQSVGCANCHRMEATDVASAESAGLTVSAKKGKPLAQLTSNAGCLADQPSVNVPKYELTTAQRDAIRSALKKSAADKQVVASEKLEFHLANSNCLACHQRGDVGGPESTRDGLFLTRMQEMGNEGRLPPTLTGVGDKLQPKYIAQTLAEGGKERPYMMTRMPGFGQAISQSMTELLVKLDAQPISHEARADTEEVMIAAGRKLVGSEGLACIKCHTFGSKATPGIQAIDMRRMSERLNEDWFHRYMLDPTRYRPGTRMPLSFPDGKSTLTTVFEGDPHRQIDAMWRYLAQGEKIREPVGLDAEAIVLKPLERPIIYRNFIEGLGPRGIAVGYPEQTNIAWDAGSMSLAMIWKNEFIDAAKHWVGRGPGNQSPLGDFVVKFEATSPLAVLEKFDSPWPTESPRARDYHFSGYKLNSAGQPSFRYRFADVSVEDQPLPNGVGGRQGSTGILRQLNIKIAKPTRGLVFRAAAGKIAAVDGGYLIDGQVRIVVTGAPMQLVDIAGKQELRAALPESGEVQVTEELTW